MASRFAIHEAPRYQIRDRRESPNRRDFLTP